MEPLQSHLKKHRRARLSRGRCTVALRKLRWLAAFATLGATDAPPAPVDLPAGTVLLLVAPWCALCWDELKRLDAIAGAVVPLHVRVLMMEDGPRGRAMMTEVESTRQWVPAVNDRVRVRAAMWARTPALPYFIATDRNGRICDEHGGGLEAERARTSARRCAMR